MRTLKNILVGLLLLVVLGGSLAEGLFRLVEPRAPGVPDRPSYLVIPAGGYRGVREFAVPADKPAGVFRIVVLGDSYTWGANVQLDATYAKHLEWLLNVTGTRTYQVINYGVNGAATRDELRLLQEVRGLQPDLVILGYFLNDPDPRRDLPPELARLFQERLQTPVWQRRFQEISRLYRFLRYRWWARRMVAAQVRYFRSLFDPAGPVWARHRKELEQIGAWSRAHRVPVMVVIWPHLGFPMDDHYPFRAIHQQLYGFFTRQQMAVLDLYPVFHGMDSNRLQTVPKFDPHPSEIAHRIAAEALYDWLRKEHAYVRRHLLTQRLKKNRIIPSVRLRMAPLEGFRIFPGR